nr:serine/threonine-protein kinase [Saccharopolyspora sp. HNM0983]
MQQQIGSGAMGVVWRAVDERLHRTVAVKQLLLQPGYTPEETEEARQRTLREGRIAARLQHQNAIVVFDTAEDEGHPVLVMEYLPSKSLASVISEQGLLNPMQVAQIGVQVAGALATAHMAGIVHRDLKPGNILLGDDGTAKITDFGISRAIGDVAVTKSGILAGTPAYLAPEVALGRDPAPASDVFSLGSTLYAAIEGEPPFGVDDNAISLLHRVARGEVEQPRQAGPMAPALMQMLRADPVERPTMAQTRDLLQAVVDGRPIPTASPNARWQYPAAAQQPQQQATRVGGPAATPPPHAGPPTRVGTGSAASGSRGSSRGKHILLWALAIIAAVLVGVLAANAFGQDTSQSQQSPPPAQQQERPAPPPATTAPATTSSAATSSAAPTTSSAPPTSSATPAQPSEQDLVAVVQQYYQLVPGDTDDAWQLLGPDLQAQGEDSYEQFWDSVDDVQIVDGPAASGGNVVVTLQFTKDGQQSNERHVLGMVVDESGQPLINTDQIG